jgi:hypothetical protein
MILEHVLNIKIFKDYYAETVYQLATNLIGEIGSLVSDSFMNSSHHFGRFSSERRSFRKLIAFALCFGQCLLIFSEEARISYLLTIWS